MFLATVDGFSKDDKDDLLLILVSDGRRLRMRASAVIQASLRPWLGDPLGQVFAVTVSGGEIMTVVPHLDREERPLDNAAAPNIRPKKRRGG